MVFLDHRRFLKPGDPLRLECSRFPRKGKPMGPPVLKDMAYVDRANKRYESARTVICRRDIAQETGCKGQYALRKLPHHDRILSTPVEPMHLVENIVEHLVRLMTGAEDSKKVRNEEKLRDRFHSSWCKKGKSDLPPAPFRLTPSELKLANQRAVSIKVPIGFDWKPNAMFIGRVAMKSHCWKLLVSTSILKYCMRGLLGNHQRHTLFFLCKVLSQLCAEEVDLSRMNAIEDDTHRALSLIERDFPVFLNVIVFHLLHHLPYYIRRFGPLYSFWMYAYERFNSWVIRRVQNRRYPEATVIETYRLYEWAHYLQQTGYLPDNAVFCPDSTSDADHKSTQCTIELDTDAFKHLQQYYRDTNSQYNTLCRRYEHDKQRARVRHQLKEFPSMKSWQPKSGPLLKDRRNRNV